MNSHGQTIFPTLFLGTPQPAPQVGKKNQQWFDKEVLAWLFCVGDFAILNYICFSILVYGYLFIYFFLLYLFFICSSWLRTPWLFRDIIHIFFNSIFIPLLYLPLPVTLNIYIYIFFLFFSLYKPFITKDNLFSITILNRKMCHFSSPCKYENQIVFFFFSQYHQNTGFGLRRNVRIKASGHCGSWSEVGLRNYSQGMGAPMSFSFAFRFCFFNSLLFHISSPSFIYPLISFFFICFIFFTFLIPLFRFLSLSLTF